MSKKKNGWKIKIGAVAVAVGLLFLLADRGVFSGLWVSPEAHAAHLVEFEAHEDEIKDELADQKLLLYELKTRVEMIQASLVRVEDKLGTERHRRRNAITPERSRRNHE